MKAATQLNLILIFLPTLLMLVSSAKADTLYVSDDSNIIEKFDTNGVGSFFANTGSQPQGEAFDNAGNLYVANDGDGTITEFDTNGVGTTFASGLVAPWALAFDGAENLYVANFGDETIWKFTTNGVGAPFIATGLYQIDGLAFDRSGNLYVASYGDGIIQKYTSPNNSTVYATNVAWASGMAFDTNGNLFVADYIGNLIWKIDTNSIVTIFTTNNLSSPDDVAFDNKGNLYVANDGVNNPTVTEFTTAGTNVVLSAGGLIGAEFIAVWPIPSQLIPKIKFSTSVTTTNHQIKLTVTGTSFVNYVLQATTNLATADWISVSTNTTPLTFVETNSFSNRFYRAMVGQ